MVGDHNSRRSLIDSVPGIVASQNTFHNDRTAPMIAYPLQVFPTDRCSCERCVDIKQLHRTLTWNDDVRQLEQSAVAQKTGQPSRTSEHLWEKRNLVERLAAHQLFHAISEIAFSQPGHGRVDCDNQGGKTGNPSTFDRSLGRPPPTQQIKLVENWP